MDFFGTYSDAGDRAGLDVANISDHALGHSTRRGFRIQRSVRFPAGHAARAHHG